MTKDGFAVVLTAILWVSGAFGAERGSARVVERMPSDFRTQLYVANREPLVPSPLVKLPIGAIKPKGWLREELVLEANGMTGHLPEISRWCQFEGSAWTDPRGQGTNGWEELPYWLKGYGDLGYVLGDRRITSTAKKWIEAVLSSQQADGWFGPLALKTGLKGKPDLWPHMVMCNVLQSYHEYTGDSRVLPFLLNYFRWLNQQPPETFGFGFWPRIRFGDNLETVYWLYNRTGEKFLLTLARNIHEHMEDWSSGVHNWHNVNIAQGFREPAVYYQQSGERKFLEASERNYRTVMGDYGQFPGGGFAGDENCRPGFTDPRQGFETCGIVEFMHSFEMLERISGDPVWSDRNEELAFNSLPAALTPDAKGLHYLTCANQVQLDAHNKAPGVQNAGTMFSYSPSEVYRCCQHNVSHGWPYYAEELWLASSDAGLCASLYSASEVSAKVAEGTGVKIEERTDYPFDDTVRLKIYPEHAKTFPVYLRIPGWCKEPSVVVNGKKLSTDARPLTYVRIERLWRSGDSVELRLPMQIDVKRWAKNKNAASVSRGPIEYSLEIRERSGGSKSWPEFEVFPATSWNYTLQLDDKEPERSLKMHCSQAGSVINPFTPETAPMWIEATARKLPSWRQDEHGLVQPLPASPVRSDEPVETVRLIPMGAARLRISMFPVIESERGR
jgi:hypothetical protein